MAISGTYRVYEDGELVSEAKNVLTTAGKKALLGILAGTSPRISRLGVGVMPTGVGGANPATTDETLFFPLADTAVEFTVPLYGGASSKVVYKSRLDETVSGVIHEIGCYNGPEINEPLLLNFGDADTDIAGPAGGDTANDVRIGPTSPRVTSTTPFTVTKQAAAGDLLGTDVIAIAVKPDTAVASTLFVQLYDNAGLIASVTYTLAASTAYQVIRQPVSAWTVANGFNWNGIASATVTRNATANNIILDGLAVLAPLQSGVLLSHAKFTTPLTKRFGVRMDLEYELSINLA